MNELIAYSLTAVGGFIAGIIVTKIVNKYKELERKIEEAILRIPTPEQMAKDIVKIKLPIGDLPPELAKEFAARAGVGLKNPLNNKNPLNTYIG